MFVGDRILEEMETALRHMKNGTATDNDHTNMESLKAREDYYLEDTSTAVL